MSAAFSTSWMLELVGCTERQLRHWNALGMLGPRRLGSGNPLAWTPSDAIRAMLIHELRSLGIPLEWCATAVSTIPPGPMRGKVLVINLTDEGTEVRWGDSPLLRSVGAFVLMDPLLDRLRRESSK